MKTLVKCPMCAKRFKSVYLVNGFCHWCGYEQPEEPKKPVVKKKKKVATC